MGTSYQHWQCAMDLLFARHVEKKTLSVSFSSRASVIPNKNGNVIFASQACALAQLVPFPSTTFNKICEISKFLNSLSCCTLSTACALSNASPPMDSHELIR